MKLSGMKKRLSVMLLVPGAGAALLFGVQQRKPAAPAEAAPAAQFVPPATIRAEGRITSYPGAQVTVGTEVQGVLRELRVEEKSQVRKGQVIALLDASEPRAALSEARARVSEATAQVNRLEADVKRNQTLKEAGAVTVQAFEHLQHELDSTRAQREAAIAQVRKMEVAVAKTRIVAPIDGVVISRMVEQGEIVSAGAPLVEIADLRRSRVEAEVDEFDSGRVALGSAVTIVAEGYDDSWKGTVEDIPDALMERHLKPQDPGRPVDTRVLPVKIAFDEATPLRLGQRVEVEITPKQSQSVQERGLGLAR
ncbi:efflux RND transporter periplasmic adaptor subunit [Hyalangium versicolor]|uniref:efflux RND transporter periplasmic adaptor subunit n=1 Tax=Hyalangium versicolor TaxID=2861190 RepID=UPI001CCCE01D|nr:efflux RND transporter periplasmic adaptor subunit [Hyalangium versicolor]